MKTQYLKGNSIEDWFIFERKEAQGGSIVWRDLISTFLLVGEWIV